MSAGRVRIHGGRVVDPASGLDGIADVCIADGRVVALGEAPVGFTADRTLSASDLIVCPGLVDLCARLREPGAERKATIASETRAAVDAGITTLCSPPDTDPVVDTAAVVELVHQRAAESGLARVEQLGALTQGLGGEQLAGMGALLRAGCPAMTNAGFPVRDTEVMRRAMEYAATFGLPVLVQAEDPWLAHGRIVHEGEISARLGLGGIPRVAEAIGVARELLLAEDTGAQVHFARLSTAEAVELVRSARARGLPVTADVAAHQLVLTDGDVDGFDSMCHVRPPLRARSDRDALRAAVADGAVSAVCSDHTPHEHDAKDDPFPLTEPGISALDTLLPLMLGLVEDDVLDLSRAIATVTSEPAAVLRLHRGQLCPGSPGDVCLFDPTLEWIPGEHTIASRGKNTPFAGRTLRGRAVCTIVGGRIVFEREGVRQ